MATDKKTTAEEAAEDTAAIDEAANAPQPDPAKDKAQLAELKRQADVVVAVDQANADELPKLGGPLLEPGLGR